MEFFHRLLEKLDWAIAGLLGSVAAAWWHRDDLINRKAWAVFIFSGELSEMLEVADAARLWGLVEWEEAYCAGLFLDHIIDLDDVSFFEKRDR